MSNRSQRRSGSEWRAHPAIQRFGDYVTVHPAPHNSHGRRKQSLNRQIAQPLNGRSARGGTRTLKGVTPADFKSAAFTSFATRARNDNSKDTTLLPAMIALRRRGEANRLTSTLTSSTGRFFRGLEVISLSFSFQQQFIGGPVDCSPSGVSRARPVGAPPTRLSCLDRSILTEEELCDPLYSRDPGDGSTA